MSTLQPLETATLADCAMATHAPAASIRAKLKDKHMRIRASGCLADSITERLKACVHEIANDTELGPILGTVDELGTVLEAVREQHVYQIEASSGRDMIVRVDPRLSVLRVHLDLDVTITLGSVAAAEPGDGKRDTEGDEDRPHGKDIETTVAAVEATLSLYDLALCTWNGDFGIFAIHLPNDDDEQQPADGQPAARSAGVSPSR